MIANVNIMGAEDKLTQTGKTYTNFKTNLGSMNCWEAELSTTLKGFIGKSVEISYLEKGNYKNIVGVNVNSAAAPKLPAINELKEPVADKKKEMYVSYAKDCFCAIITRISQDKFDKYTEEQIAKLMDLAIICVKRAQEAF